MDMLRFSGRVALVTGGGSGIGAAVTRQLCEGGAEAVYIWGRTPQRLDSMAAALERCEAMCVDVSDEAAVCRGVEAIVRRHGRVDLLANMAAITGPAARTEDYAFADFERVYRINVFGTFLTMKYCLPYMQRMGFGAIVNACSCSGMRGYPREIGYGSGKAAVLGMTRNAASENGHNGVRVNCVSPGWVDTPMLEQVLRGDGPEGAPPRGRAELKCGTMQRPSLPEEVAHAVCFLLSEEARYINGANLVCDGGKTVY